MTKSIRRRELLDENTRLMKAECEKLKIAQNEIKLIKRNMGEIRTFRTQIKKGKFD